MKNTTIAAIATAQGRAAIAIIRVSGPGALNAFKLLTKSKTTPTRNALKVRWLYYEGHKIDQAMLVYFMAPDSFTGEEMIEIHCHGSKVVQGQILKALYSFHIEPAKPGEFSKRAYYNGKIDIAQAEAIMELVASENSQVARLATRQLAGEFSNKINGIRASVIELSSAISADLDFSEEDTPIISKVDISKSLSLIAKEIGQVMANSDILPILREGIHVALIGLPNAGKSTLLNSLLGYDRSIVTDIAGTTRDTVTESVEIEGTTFHFTDTAGLNTSPDSIEKMGIKKSIDSLKGSDIVLLLIEADKQEQTNKYLESNNLLGLTEQKNVIKVITKSDILSVPGELCISAKTNKGIKELIAKVVQLSGAQLSGSTQILTIRQLNILTRSELTITSLSDNLKSLSYDIISSELESCVKDLSELTGEHANVQIINSIFRNFCIGK